MPGAHPPDPVACAVFLLTAFVLAGFAQIAWFNTRWSHSLALPLDFGLTFRGRRLLGPNKTLRGFVVMMPAATASFALLAVAIGDPSDASLWPLSASAYAALGGWAALGFMAGELPNSFIKRQLDIEPGGVADYAPVAVCQFAADRLDSGIGMLVATSLMVPTSATTWIVVLTAGPLLHWSFSVLMFWLGLKTRPA
jgi:hypothetical protein